MRTGRYGQTRGTRRKARLRHVPMRVRDLSRIDGMRRADERRAVRRSRQSRRSRRSRPARRRPRHTMGDVPNHGAHGADHGGHGVRHGGRTMYYREAELLPRAGADNGAGDIVPRCYSECPDTFRDSKSPPLFQPHRLTLSAARQVPETYHESSYQSESYQYFMVS